MYYEDLEEYEKTQLRQFFLTEMRRACPEWIKFHSFNEVKVDFGLIVQ
jgi:hypothetical protein